MSGGGPCGGKTRGAVCHRGVEGLFSTQRATRVKGASVSVESTNVEVIESDDTLEAEELLVEEVSIDGLCGVY